MLNPEKLFQLLDPTGKACDVTVVSSMELSLETDATLKRELFSMRIHSLDNTRLFMCLTAGAGTRCMSLLSSSPSLTSMQLILGPSHVGSCITGGLDTLEISWKKVGVIY